MPNVVAILIVLFYFGGTLAFAYAASKARSTGGYVVLPAVCSIMAAVAFVQACDQCWLAFNGQPIPFDRAMPLFLWFPGAIVNLMLLGFSVSLLGDVWYERKGLGLAWLVPQSALLLFGIGGACVNLWKVETAQAGLVGLAYLTGLAVPLIAIVTSCLVAYFEDSINRLCQRFLGMMRGKGGSAIVLISAVAR
jgi:hypothetical protein